MPIIGGGIIGGGSGEGTPDTTTESRIPYKSVSSFVNSPLYYDSVNNRVVCDTTFEAPAGTVALGETTEISASTGAVLVRNTLSGAVVYSCFFTWDQFGSDPPKYMDIGEIAGNVIQSDFSQTLTTNPLIWQNTTVAIPGDFRQIDTFTIKTGAVMTNARAKITDNATGIVMRYIPSREAWNAGTGLTLVSGNNTFDFISVGPSTPGNYKLGVNPFLVYSGQVIDFELQADSVNILGNISNVPYQEAGIQDITFRNVAVISSTSSDIDHIATFGSNTAQIIGQSPLAKIIGANAELRFEQPVNVIQGRIYNDSTTFNISATKDIEIANGANDTFISSRHIELVTTNYCRLQSSYGDTLGGLQLIQTGLNGGVIEIFSGTRDPNGFVAGAGGYKYFRNDPNLGATYTKRTSTGTTDWVNETEGAYLALNRWTSTINRISSIAVRAQTVTANTWVELFGFIGEIETTPGKLEPTNNRILVKQIDDSTNGDLYKVNFTGALAATTNAVMSIRIYVTDGVSQVGGENNTIIINGIIGRGNTFTEPVTLSGILRGPKTLAGAEPGFLVQGMLGSSQTIYQKALFLSVERIK